ncbi:MAG: NADH-quinone oxidoreductase subunit L [Deltaproteobacteria bacterium]|nr:NADH-quinone oxidoreductase subunit L [Deltaproteobacteria bacterium]
MTTMLSQVLPWAWLFPLPFLVLSALGIPRKAGALSFVGPLAIFVAALGFLLGDRATQKVVFDGWIPFLPDPAFRLTADGLAAVMLAVVGGVATCVFVYAIAYMKDDERAHRFFAFLDLFVATMSLLVVAGNLTVLLAGWTGVGIASFLLISFWWTKTLPDGTTPLQAGFLALGANAVGDAALLVACVLLPRGGGALDTLAQSAPRAPGGVLTVGLCLVIAAAAKSAQGPLWFWLPSAMAGPTPVSALIHAATMVAAGVYLLVRTAPLLEASPEVLTVITVVGLSTALLGGMASLWQTNFKRGIAYSTASQLGWMFVAVGVGAPFAAFFHLVTHASFKAMMFLSAGTVIHAAHHEEDIRKVGGLAGTLKGAHAFFLIGLLALIGTPFVTSGGISKEAILAAAHHHTSQPWVFWALLAGVFVTGAYGGRLYFGIFHGKKGEASAHAHGDHLAAFDLPLLPLAAGALGLGYLEGGTGLLHGLLGNTVKPGLAVHVVPDGMGWLAFGIAVAGVLFGRFLAGLPQKGLPVPGGEGGSSVVAEVRILPEGLAALHGGRVGRYLFLTMLGAAVVAGLSLRPPSGELPRRVGRAPAKASASADKADKADRNQRGKGGASSGERRPGGRPGVPAGLQDALRNRLRQNNNGQPRPGGAAPAPAPAPPPSAPAATP